MCSPILIKVDSIDGYIYACPYCHRYVTRENGVRTCRKCGGLVNQDQEEEYDGPVSFDGRASWMEMTL